MASNMDQVDGNHDQTCVYIYIYIYFFFFFSFPFLFDPSFLKIANMELNLYHIKQTVLDLFKTN